MHDRRDGEYDDRGSRHEHGRHEHGRHEHGRGEGRGGPRGDDRCGPDRGSREDCHDERDDRRAPSGGGPDTRFLQLEMSQVLFAEAESVTREAFRELLIEAAKARFRERFGDKITGLAQLAVDELMNDVRSSLDIEGRIREHNQERARTKERLRDIFGAPEEGGPRREGEGGEGGGGPGADHDENT